MPNYSHFNLARDLARHSGQISGGREMTRRCYEGAKSVTVAVSIPVPKILAGSK